MEDFAGRFIVKTDLELSQKDFFARFGVPDLVLYVYFKKGGQLKSEAFDILSKKDEKEDFPYLRSAWLYLLNSGFLDDFHIIHVFSDGGPKHFKIRKSIFFFSLLDTYYPQKFIWNFFQSCHGKV